MKPISRWISMLGIAGIIFLNTQCRETSKSNSEPTPQLTAVDRFWLFGAACSNGDEIGVRILLRLGADVDGFNDYKKFQDAGYVENSGWGVEPSWPINQAARKGHTNIVKILIEEGAKLDSFDGEGNTALINAAYHGHMEIVKMLLDAGADPNLRGVNNWSPADAAKAGQHEEIHKLLLGLSMDE